MRPCCRSACSRRSGQLLGAAKQGLLGLSVGVGLGVLMEQQVSEVVGPKGKHDPDRAAVRHGHEPGEVTVLERMLAGVSTRRYARADEPVGEEVAAKARSVSKSSVSRTFVERTREALSGADGPAPARRAPGGDDAQLDRPEGPHQHRRPGITRDGVKLPLGLWEGSSENATSPRRSCPI